MAKGMAEKTVVIYRKGEELSSDMNIGMSGTL
jgi:hypothetical protein